MDTTTTKNNMQVFFQLNTLNKKKLKIEENINKLNTQLISVNAEIKEALINVGFCSVLQEKPVSNSPSGLGRKGFVKDAVIGILNQKGPMRGTDIAIELGKNTCQIYTLLKSAPNQFIQNIDKTWSLVA